MDKPAREGIELGIAQDQGTKRSIIRILSDTDAIDRSAYRIVGRVVLAAPDEGSRIATEQKRCDSGAVPLRSGMKEPTTVLTNPAFVTLSRNKFFQYEMLFRACAPDGAS